MKVERKKKETQRGLPNYEHIFRENEGNIQEQKKKKFPKFLFTMIGVRSIVCSVFLYVAKVVPSLLVPFVTAQIINVGIAREENVIQAIAWLALLCLFLIATNMPLHVLGEKYTSRILRNTSAGLRGTLIRKLQNLSITFYNEMENGRIQAKFIRDIEAIEQMNSTLIKILLPTIMIILVSVGIAASKSWMVAVLYVCIAPLNLLPFFFQGKLKKSQHEFRLENENTTAKLSGMVDMLPVTKAHGLENREIENVEEKVKHLRDRGIQMDNVLAYFSSGMWTVNEVLSLLCLLITLALAVGGRIQFGDIVMFQSYFATISDYLQQLVGVLPVFGNGIEGLQSLSNIIQSDDIEDNRDKIELQFVHGTINFDHVYFRYPQSKNYSIRDFNLAVEPGECVAFVGGSGSGKSTIMNMIIGFLQPTTGTVRIDGKPIEALNLSEYRHFISVVSQNVILFQGTIRDNITYGISNISEERLQEVVRLANIDEFINRMPLGLETRVGEGGASLSGGQKQRISIARALIRDPKILILDEATSALDNAAEFHVQQAIGRLTEGRTTFIVAHRLSTIRNADRIVVMEQGACVETGTYAELMEKKGRFYELKALSDVTAGMEA